MTYQAFRVWLAARYWRLAVFSILIFYVVSLALDVLIWRHSVEGLRTFTQPLRLAIPWGLVMGYYFRRRALKLQPPAETSATAK